MKRRRAAALLSASAVLFAASAPFAGEAPLPVMEGVTSDDVTRMIAESRAPAPARIPVAVHAGHFVRNTYKAAPGGSVLMFGDYASFERVIGAGAVMGAPANFVKAETFADSVVFAVVRPGLWTFELARGVADANGVDISYYSAHEPAEFEAVSLFVFSVPHAGMETARTLLVGVSDLGAKPLPAAP